jgi:aryl-alcohol dehydrogenase-like predicted oxidoreductase
VHDNLKNLELDALDVVNLRVGGVHEPNESPIAHQFETLAELQRQGLIRQLGLSNVTSAQIREPVGHHAVLAQWRRHALVPRPSRVDCRGQCHDRVVLCYIPYRRDDI